MGFSSDLWNVDVMYTPTRELLSIFGPNIYPQTPYPPPHPRGRIFAIQH